MQIKFGENFKLVEDLFVVVKRYNNNNYFICRKIHQRYRDQGPQTCLIKKESEDYRVVTFENYETANYYIKSLDLDKKYTIDKANKYLANSFEIAKTWGHNPDLVVENVPIKKSKILGDKAKKLINTSNITTRLYNYLLNDLQSKVKQSESNIEYHTKSLGDAKRTLNEAITTRDNYSNFDTFKFCNSHIELEVQENDKIIGALYD